MSPLPSPHPVGYLPLSGAGWYKRLQAALLAHAGTVHSRLVAERKRALFGGLQGQVLEVGAGGGANLAFYPPGVHLTALEPNRYAVRRLERTAAAYGVAARVVEGVAEALPLPDASVDAVTCTLVLCTVHDVPAALSEVLRVLRPGGRFVFLEHVAAPEGSRTARLQHAVRPVWRALADGCNPDRRTGEAIEAAGFAQVRLEHFQVDVPVVGPHLAGVAVKAG